MRVAIFEPNHLGHRFSHVRRMVAAVAALGAEVVVLTSRAAAESAEYRVQLRPLEGRFALRTDSAGFVGDQVEYCRQCVGELKHLMAGGGVDHVLFPYADGTTQVAGLMRLSGRFRVPRGVEVEALMFRGALAYEPGRGLKRAVKDRLWLLGTAAAPWTVLHHMDPIALEAIVRRAGGWFGLRRRARLIPDPVEPPERLTVQAARRRLGLPEDGRMIGTAGWLDARKGIDLLIEAFAAAPLRETDRLLLVGHQEPDIKAAVAAHGALVRSGRIVSLDRYLSDEEFTLGIAAMDVVCTPYPRHIGSASVVIHAAAQGRPVLSGRFGWLGATVERFGLGTLCDVEEVAALAGRIGPALDGAAGFALNEAGRRFVEFHSAANFEACWTVRLRERMGLAPLPAHRSWSWVEEAA